MNEQKNVAEGQEIKMKETVKQAITYPDYFLSLIYDYVVFDGIEYRPSITIDAIKQTFDVRYTDGTNSIVEISVDVNDDCLDNIKTFAKTILDSIEEIKNNK